VLEQGAENVNQPTGEELETVEMCTDVAGARLGCQLIVRGDVTIRQID
jgi:ferredoxin